MAEVKGIYIRKLPIAIGNSSQTKIIENVSIPNDLLNKFCVLKEKTFNSDEQHMTAVNERMKEGIFSLMNIMIFN